VKNALNGLQFGFGYSADAIVVALAGHGPSAVYAYADRVWVKYRLGEFFKLSDAAGAPVPTIPQVCTRTRRSRCCSGGA
jgi:hypothetical protein